MRYSLMTITLGMLACGGSNPALETGPVTGSPLDDTIASLEKWSECETFTTSQGLTCEDLEGGTEYLVGDIKFNANAELGGALYYVLVANTPMTKDPEWVAAGLTESCRVGYAVTGEWIAEGNEFCPDCTHTMNYNTEYSAAMTTCNQAIVTFANNRFDGADFASWYMKVDASTGSAVAYDTQNMWAPNGTGDASGVLVYSDKKCQWLGVSECS